MKRDPLNDPSRLLMSLESSVDEGIYDVYEALCKAYEAGVMQGKVEGIDIAKRVIAEATLA